jgi:hypothetical protein
MQGVSINNGVVTIKVDIPANGSADWQLYNAVTTKIGQLFGVTEGRMTDIADHWMYCLPRGSRMNGDYSKFTSLHTMLHFYSTMLTCCISLFAQLDWSAHGTINGPLSVYNDKWW